MGTPINFVIWISLVLWELSYVRVAYQIAGPIEKSDSEEKLFLSLFVVAIAIGVGSVIYRRKALVLPISSGEVTPPPVKPGASGM